MSEERPSGVPDGARPIRVLVVDDQVLVRKGLSNLLDLEDAVEVVGEAEDGLDALEKIPQLDPEVVLVDARMPRMDGVELVGRLAREWPQLPAVILTTFDDDEYIFGGLRAGAQGYLLKDTPPEELVAAMKKAKAGDTVLGGPIASRVVSELDKSPETPGKMEASEASENLSEREVEVLKLIGSGATNEEIACTLYISEGTARNHVSKILRKLRLRDRTQAALYAAECGRTEDNR